MRTIASKAPKQAGVIADTYDGFIFKVYKTAQEVSLIAMRLNNECDWEHTYYAVPIPYNEYVQS